MKHNVTLNHLESTVQVAELNWCAATVFSLALRGFDPLNRGMPVPTAIRRPNIILVADCVYFEPAFPLLVETLDDLSDPTTEILFCYKKRRKVCLLSHLVPKPDIVRPG